MESVYRKDSYVSSSSCIRVCICLKDWVKLTSLNLQAYTCTLYSIKLCVNFLFDFDNLKQIAQGYSEHCQLTARAILPGIAALPG